MISLNKISDRASAVTPSTTLSILARVRKMQADGARIFNFTVGEPDFDTPNYIKESGKFAIDSGKTKYTASAGVLQLREAICQKLATENNLTYKPSQIVVSNGAKQSIYNAAQAIINPGDEVIILAPYWLTYPESIRLCGGIPVVVETSADNNFKVTPAQLEAAITKKTKAIIFNSPSNPTGTVYSESEIRALAAVLEKSGIWIISDEIYEKLVYDGARHFSIATVSQKLYDKTIVINGMSKAYAMTGWRIGYTASSQILADAMDNMQSHTTSNPNTIAQYASITALGGAQDELNAMIAEFDARRKYMVDRLSKMPKISIVAPTGAFYIMVNVSALGTPAKIAEQLIERAHIAAIPCEAFGAPEYIRFCYTLSMKDITDGMDALERFLAEK
jgi:aspartate aminotransferase